MSDLGLSMQIAELQGQIHAALAQIGALKQALACAICAECSEHIAGEPFVVRDSDGSLVHEACDK